MPRRLIELDDDYTNYIIREFDRVPRHSAFRRFWGKYYIIREFDRVPRQPARRLAAAGDYIIREFDRVPRLNDGIQLVQRIISSGNLIGCQGDERYLETTLFIISSGNLIGCQGGNQQEDM